MQQRLDARDVLPGEAECFPSLSFPFSSFTFLSLFKTKFFLSNDRGLSAGSTLIYSKSGFRTSSCSANACCRIGSIVVGVAVCRCLFEGLASISVAAADAVDNCAPVSLVLKRAGASAKAGLDSRVRERASDVLFVPAVALPAASGVSLKAVFIGADAVDGVGLLEVLAVDVVVVELVVVEPLLPVDGVLIDGAAIGEILGTSPGRVSGDR